MDLYNTKSFAIVGYTFNADTYCDGVCVLEAMGVPTPETGLEVESVLDSVAMQRNINRYDEASYDSGSFPKVVFSSMVERPESCGGCGGYLDGVDIRDYERCEEHGGWKHKEASECLC